MLGLIKKYKNIMIGIVVVIAGFFAYTYFFTGEERVALLSSESSAEAASAAGAEILALLRDLKALRLDDSIFTDPVFQRLEDFGVEIAPEPVGRSNPFAPIGEE